MAQNINDTTKTIGLWCLANPNSLASPVIQKAFSPRVAQVTVNAALKRFCDEGYLLRVGRGFYEINPDKEEDFRRRCTSLAPGSFLDDFFQFPDPDVIKLPLQHKEQLAGYTWLVYQAAARGPEEFEKAKTWIRQYAEGLVYSISRVDRITYEEFIEGEEITPSPLYDEVFGKVALFNE